MSSSADTQRIIREEDDEDDDEEDDDVFWIELGDGSMKEFNLANRPLSSTEDGSCQPREGFFGGILCRGNATARAKRLRVGAIPRPAALAPPSRHIVRAGSFARNNLSGWSGLTLWARLSQLIGWRRNSARRTSLEWRNTKTFGSASQS